MNNNKEKNLLAVPDKTHISIYHFGWADNLIINQPPSNRDGN